MGCSWDCYRSDLGLKFFDIPVTLAGLTYSVEKEKKEY